MALTQIPPVMIDGEFGLDWQSSVETSSFTAVTSKGYFVNTTSGDITVTLPTSPTVGNSVGVMDYAGTTSTNKIILTSSNNIQSSSDNKAIRYNRGVIRITYSGATQGWIVSAAANEGTSALRPPIDLLHYLVVAGGGGGGQYAGSGGGGGGGLRTSWPGGSGGGQPSETALNLSLGINYTISVGLGGAAGWTGSILAANGIDSYISHSSITDIISTGGGRGGGYANGFYSPQQGGSGGGGTYAYAGNMPGAAAVTSPVVQGYAGGNGWNSSTSNGGGGGGAGAIGSNGANFVGADGGPGLEVNIIGGTGNYYAGGGGGGIYPYNASYSKGNGGNGVGGNGGVGDTPTGFLATDGSPNTGGGGGGNGSSNQNQAAGAGGSGIVILRCTIATATLGSGITVNSTTGPGTVNGVAITGTDDYYYSATAGTGTITF